MDHDGGGMDDSMSGGGGGMDMNMDHSMRDTHSVFHNTHTTALYSTQWMPSDTGTYAGTCIFLIFFAVIFRALLASKTLVEHRWLQKSHRRRYIVTADGDGNGSGNGSGDAVDDEEGATKGTLVTSQGKEENVRVVHQSAVPSALPWRLSTDLPRALLVTVIVAVGYLL